MTAVVCLFSCKSKQAIVTDSSSVVSVTDTTKVSKDTATYLRTDIDTTKTTGEFSGGGTVEFVEGGGKVSIDTAGNVTLEGVKNIKHHHKRSVTQDKGVAEAEEITAGHTEQLNGITNDQTHQDKTETKPTHSLNWYEKIIILCCIAFLTWMLIRCIKQED